MKDHSEITELLEMRLARRRRMAELSFEEKIEMIERMRELQFNRSLMQACRTGEQPDEYVKPEEMTHP